MQRSDGFPSNPTEQPIVSVALTRSLPSCSASPAVLPIWERTPVETQLVSWASFLRMGAESHWPTYPPPDCLRYSLDCDLRYT